MTCVKSLLELWDWLLDETASRLEDDSAVVSLELGFAALDSGVSELLEY